MADRRFYNLTDGRLSALHFNSAAGDPQIIFAHANGFNGLAYRQIFEPLGVHAIALDLRGHGQSELPTHINGLRNWHVFRDDIAAFFDQVIERPVILGGHSFGAVSAILAAPKMKNKLSGFVGLDPVTLPFLSRHWPYLPGGRWMMKTFIPIAKKAGRRRHQFDSAEAAFDNYQGRGAFRKMPDEMLRDYLEGGLLPHEDGVRLACDPAWEQAVFAAQGHNIYKGAKALPKNSKIIYGGKAAVSDRFTRAKIGRIIGHQNIEFNPDFHHLFPFHHPDAVRQCFIETLRRATR